jgi:hypothetical protein
MILFSKVLNYLKLLELRSDKYSTYSLINKIFSGYKLCQQTKTGRRFRDISVSILTASELTTRANRPKYIVPLGPCFVSGANQWGSSLAPDTKQGPRRTIFFGWFALIVTSDALRMGIEIVPETSANFSLLTRRIAREDFINLCRRESFKSYNSIYSFK